MRIQNEEIIGAKQHDLQSDEFSSTLRKLWQIGNDANSQLPHVIIILKESKSRISAEHRQGCRNQETFLHRPTLLIRNYKTTKRRA